MRLKHFTRGKGHFLFSIVTRQPRPAMYRIPVISTAQKTVGCGGREPRVHLGGDVLVRRLEAAVATGERAADRLMKGQ